MFQLTTPIHCHSGADRAGVLFRCKGVVRQNELEDEMVVVRSRLRNGILYVRLAVDGVVVRCSGRSVRESRRALSRLFWRLMRHLPTQKATKNLRWPILHPPHPLSLSRHPKSTFASLTILCQLCVSLPASL